MKLSKTLLSTSLAVLLSLPTISLAESPDKIDLNTATVAQLMSVKGIGEAKAAAIVAYRQDHGQFKSVADLGDVSGIGAKRLAQIARYLRVDKPSAK